MKEREEKEGERKAGREGRRKGRGERGRENVFPYKMTFPSPLEWRQFLGHTVRLQG